MAGKAAEAIAAKPIALSLLFLGMSSSGMSEVWDKLVKVSLSNNEPGVGVRPLFCILLYSNVKQDEDCARHDIDHPSQ